MKNLLVQIKSGLFILDGAMGTLLSENGLPPGVNPAYANFMMPDTVKEIHKAYLTAGARMILTDTLCASGRKLLEQPMSPPVTSAETVTRAVRLAKEATAGYDAFVALDIGSIGELIEPTGTLSFNEAYEQFKVQVIAGEKAGADAVFIETITDLQEMRCALLAVKENSNLPVFCTMSFEESMRTFTGTCLQSFAVTIEGLGADAIGINCSLGPAQIAPMLKELLKWTSLPVIAKPNAGMPSIVNGKTVFNVGPTEFAEQMAEIVKLGINIIGGCCGSSPTHIEKLAALECLPQSQPREKRNFYTVCSSSKMVEIDRVRIIGERINPTGKKRFKQALLNGDMQYILSQAVEQVEVGADILDVNVGLPGIDEPAVLASTVIAVQGITDVPLQIDSTNPAAVEAALRVYCGKAIVNSVSGEESSLSAILPIVKKYGAAVVGLAMDDDGIPKTAEKRLVVAKHIIDRASACGIPKNDVIIDCLTLTAGAEQETAYETLKALRLVKEQLNVKTVLGVSNISFGLPGRERLNQVFLTMALENGLDLPIINPNNTEMVDTVFCFHQLRNIDAGSTLYIDRFKEIKIKQQDSTKDGNNSRGISFYIQKGLKDETRAACIELLKETDGLSVVNGHLIPALDEIGKSYETGRIFLPELMKASEAAKAGFEAVKETLPQKAEESADRIILATVKGDVHDIGKNIVMSILMSYGYEVTDLGKDVDAESVVNAAMEYGIKLVGLSALMTTTVPSMEQTIKELKAQLPKIKIMVGGAVLTEDYALSIGADYYAKDAMDAVSIAKRVFSDK